MNNGQEIDSNPIGKQQGINQESRGQQWHIKKKSTTKQQGIYN